MNVVSPTLQGLYHLNILVDPILQCLWFSVRFLSLNLILSNNISIFFCLMIKHNFIWLILMAICSQICFCSAFPHYRIVSPVALNKRNSKKTSTYVRVYGKRSSDRNRGPRGVKRDEPFEGLTATQILLGSNIAVRISRFLSFYDSLQMIIV